MENVILAFINRSAESHITLEVTRGACPYIAQWYGGYHAGDDYDVTIDGKLIEKDINGELL